MANKKQKNQKVIVYTTETCPYCKQVKELFNNEGIEFEERKTVDYQEEWNGIMGLTTLPNLPTVFFNGNYLCPGRDFGQPQHLVDRIKTEAPSTFSDEVRIFEKLKTLNFQMSTAFMKTDQILKNLEQTLFNIQSGWAGYGQDDKNKEENEHKSTD
jgi:glutaredoxin